MKHFLLPSESETERHLNLARTADGFVGDAKTAEAEAHVKCGHVEAAVARRDCGRQSLLREAVEVDVLADIVDWDIEAGGIGQVIHVEAVAKGEALGQLCHFDVGDICATLPGLPEDVALSVVNEVRLVRVVRGYCSIQLSWGEKWQTETFGTKGVTIRVARVCVCARRSGHCLFWRATRERNDGIGDPVVDAIENTAHCSDVVHDAVRLAALNDGEP